MRSEVSDEDLEFAARRVLAPRATCWPAPAEQQSAPEPETSPESPPETAPDQEPAPDPSQEAEQSRPICMPGKTRRRQIKQAKMSPQQTAHQPKICRK
jgi:Mg-chelatase subunit ChlI